MEDKSLELLTEEQRKLHDEFNRCETWEEVQEFLKKVKKMNESQENNVIPHYNMTWDEFCRKYNVTPLEEIERRMWGK